MKCKEIIAVLECQYPKSAALSFDNVGLLAGRQDKEINAIYIALDATEEVIRHAKKNQVDMLITHHPLFLSPIKKITDEDFIGKRLVELIRNDISYYAMHTNYDVLGMAQLSADILSLSNLDILNVTNENEEKPEGIGRIGELPTEMTLEDCCLFVKDRLKLNAVKVFGEKENLIKRLAISPGSGKSAIVPAIEKGANVLVTGDVGHHDGLDAVEQGLSIIDAGHYGTEYIFLDDMKTFIQKKLPKLKVIVEPISHPFQII